MKYLTLCLLVLVFLYGIDYAMKTKKAIATSSFFLKEIPIYSVHTSQPLLALTFDNAWEDHDVDAILNVLKKHHISATFFVTGEWARRYPNVIRKIHEAGHEIGNHGNSHIHLPQCSKKKIATELQACHNIVYEIIQEDMTLFRAPYSDWNREIVEVAHMLGYSAINHSVDSLDWKNYSAKQIVKTVCNHKNLENGSIILLHCGTRNTKDALDVMLTNLEKKGYRFVPLSSLIYKNNYYLDHTGKQFPKNPEEN